MNAQESDQSTLPADNGQFKERVDQLSSRVQALPADEETQEALAQDLDRFFDDVIKIQKKLRQEKQKAEEVSEKKSFFVERVSHDLRTPLNSILGVTEALQEQSFSDETIRNHVNVLRNATQSMTFLIHDILDLEKIESDRLSLENVPFNLREVIDSQIQLFQPQVRGRDVSLQKEIDPSIPEHVIGDPNRLKQILNNLLGNAVKFTESGTISIRIQPVYPEDQPDFIEFEVSDTGIGIPEEEQKKIFETFNQASSPVLEDVKSTGLGLSICKHLVEQMGGEIAVESQEGKGSTFRFTVQFSVPESEEEPQEEPVESTEKARAQPTEPACGKAPEADTDPDHLQDLKVLMAEDSRESQELYKIYLMGKVDELETVSTGEEALDRFRNESFDCVFLDMEMPRMDGFEAVKEIRRLEEQEDLPYTPVVAISALTEDEYQEKAVDMGFDCYLTKPVKKSRLVECVTDQTGVELADDTTR